MTSNAGHMYDKGEGVPEDLAQAFAWWNLAAAQGKKDAAKSKEIVRKQMPPEQIAEAQGLSGQWVEDHPMLLRR